MRNVSSLATLAIVLIVLLLAENTQAAAPGVEIIALRGEPVPGHGSFYDYFLEPVLSNTGSLAFASRIEFELQDLNGIFRTDEKGTVFPVAIEGEMLPESDQTYSRFTSFDIDNRNNVVFRTRYDGGNGSAIIRERRGRLTEIASTNPSSSEYFEDLGDPSFNRNGNIAFVGTRDSDGGPRQGIYQILRGIRPLVTSDDPVPNSNDSFLNFYQPTINDRRAIAFGSQLENAPSESDIGLYLYDINGIGLELVREGQTVPDGNGVFDYLWVFPPSLNNSNQVVFRARIRDSNVPRSEGIFLASEDSVEQIATIGATAPGTGEGTFSRLAFPVLNDAGTVAFTGSRLGDSAQHGLFKYKEGSLDAFILEGDLLPGSTEQFTGFGDIALNNRDEIAFLAHTTDPSRRTGLFLANNQGKIQELIRIGDDFAGSTVSHLRLSLLGGDTRSGLNDVGQVAFAFTLTDGRNGLARYTRIPEPSSILLLTIAIIHFPFSRNSRLAQGS